MNLHSKYLPDAPFATNLVDRLRYWSQHRSEKPAFLFLNEQDEVLEVTYCELDRQARAIAAKLAAMGFRGERVLLFYPPGLDFVAAFFGCLYSGNTAVPAFPPRRNRNMARVEAISEDAQAAVVLSVQEVIERSESVLDDDAEHLREIPWLATDQVPLELAENWTATEFDIDSLAVLQYTSGSTGQPKGVMLTHANLMHNCSIITQGFEADQSSIGLSWLPTYHDMGLVGGILNPLFIGRPNIFMAPMSFLQKPIRWLQNISRFKVTISGGPNFAYALCNEKISDAECDGLDLSTWKVAFNGAEPIRADTLGTFAEKFRPFGFRASAFYPCYGMAESTLIVSGAECQTPPTIETFDSVALESNLVVPLNESNGSGRRLVSSGRVLPGQTVLIVDPETCQPLAHKHVGEIWIQSESVARGYWNNPQETQRAFGGRPANVENGSSPFLRSGDLGFVHDNELYVSGRSKDLIIINGRNLYPHDFESVVENAHEAIRVGGGVAFSVEAGSSEKLVIAQELVREYRKYDLDEIIAAIRKSVFDSLNVAPHSIVLLKVGKLPKTSSGKVQRLACRDQFLSGRLNLLAQWPAGQQASDERKEERQPHNESESIRANGRTQESIVSWLVHRIAKQLNISESKIDTQETFAHFGLDSVTLIGISGELETWLGASVSPKLLFNYPTISELSEHLAALDLTGPENPAPLKSATTIQPRVNTTGPTREFRGPQPEISASEMLANLGDLSASETVALLTKLLQEKALEETTDRRLSLGQQALWFIYQLAPASAAYNIMYAARVRQDLDRAAFCRAFQTIIDRHEILRTTYTTVDGLPVQRVHPFQKLDIQEVDARNLNQDQLDMEIQSHANRPFDLEQGPVLRVLLFRRNDGQDIMLFVVHHIALDFWSFDLLFDELESFYRHQTTGEDPGIPEAKTSYHDFVLWQKQLLGRDEGEQLWEYWRDQLGGELPALDLPTDFPRPRQQSFRGKSFPFQVSDSLTGKLAELSKSEGVTLFTTFLATFQLLLYRYSGQQDIVVGCPAAGRSRKEFEHVFGYFVNPVALRSNLTANLTFTDFLKQVRETLIDGITHQDYPFGVLVERLQIPRDPGRSPVFQAAISWDTPRKLQLNDSPPECPNGQALPVGSMGLTPFAMGQQGSAFDVMMMLLHSDESVSGTIQYNSDLFAESTIAPMAGHFQTLLENIAENPDSRLGTIPLMEASEQQEFLNSCNDSLMENQDVHCVHELIERQVAQTPDAIAIECNGRQLSYWELNERSNQIAHHLVELGVGPGDLVGIFIDRSIEMMVGLIGILKSGGAYVPISPQTPRQRIAEMLIQCEAPVVLTNKTLAGTLPESTGHVVCLDSDWSKIQSNSNRNPARHARSSDLAYVIFTSGSTGQPKGVQIEHRSVVNFLTSMQREPGINSDDVLLAVTTFTFDISVLELLLPLTTGAKVVVIAPEIAADGIQLAKVIEDANTTIMQATPATWRMLIEAGWKGDQRLKILCGGEAMPPDLADLLLDRCDELWNMYGPTETTIWSTVDHVQLRSNPMPIGRPIANTRVYILDDQLQPVPPGVRGNLYIAGEGLARGYLGQPKLTAEKFVPDPFCKGDQKRMYKTGDLARTLANTKIEFLGREDLQVKVRGFRIELEEIETRLAACPDIRQAVVVACQRESRIDDKQLVAYFTSRNGPPSTSPLREMLQQDLPDYMIPSIFVPLDEFPLNTAGKIDRNALPKPDMARPDLRASYVAPRDEIEKKLAETWGHVLNLDKVGIHDNFFELGGASMQSLEISAIARKHGIEMLPASLFQYPTIAKLAENGLTHTAANSNDELISMEKERVSTSVHFRSAPGPTEKSKQIPVGETNNPNVLIESIGVYLPPKTVTTREVVQGCKNKIWFPLEDMTGIRSRHVAAEDEFTSDIACRAVKECLDNSKYAPELIDLVICCHIGRDEQPHSAALEPGTAMYLKQRFQFPNAIAFDINNACAGMFTGIRVAESYISSGAARRAIVVSAEHISPVMATAQHEISGFIDPRIACLTLGDAGAAIILEAAPNDDSGFAELDLYSLSQYSSMCVGRPTEQSHGGPILVVPDPIKHTSIAIENSIAHSKLILDRSQWEPDDIQWVIMHQTSERSLLDGARAINQTFHRKICTNENTINNLIERGNTASTSHFVAVWDNILNGRFASGDNVVFGITGSGQTIGTGLYKFDDLPDRIRTQKQSTTPAKKIESTDVPRRPVRSPVDNRVRAHSIGVATPENTSPAETMPMVKQAVENCLNESEYERSKIELVLFAGVYRTGFISEPALATMIANDLHINDAVQPDGTERTLAFDVINGGPGFLTAIDIASQMIRSGQIRTALVIAAEVENNTAEYPDQLIGLKETASAILLDQGIQPRVGFGDIVFHYRPDSLNARTVTGKYTSSSPQVCLKQDSDIGELYLPIVADSVSELLEREGLSMDDISLVLPSQFSAVFLDELARILKIPRVRFVDLTGEGKDWFTSSLPQSLHEIKTRSLAKPGDIGLVINVGAGLQVGCATYYF